MQSSRQKAKMVQDAYDKILATFKLGCLLKPSTQMSPKILAEFQSKIRIGTVSAANNPRIEGISQCVSAPEKTN